MGSLLLNFTKRAVIIPLIITGLIIAAVTFIAPSAIKKSEARFEGASNVAGVDLSKYSTRHYQKFSELSEDDLAGIISSDDIEIPEAAVLYDSHNILNVWLSAQSKEPWNNGGGIIIRGSNVSNQLKGIYSAKEGNRITVDFLSNGKYEYEISKVYSGVSEDEIEGYSVDNSLVIAMPYNYFTDSDNSYLYFVYVAKLV